MKKTIATLLVGSLLAAGALFAADAKVEAKAAGCCTKAGKDGKACTHECCVAAAKEGKNCAKCGGAGMLAKKEEKKK
ncbi:MAG: hypothetical protein RLZZ15_129 [Verrucomicrobiota bacterium]|jgi:hypothetical protein